MNRIVFFVEVKAANNTQFLFIQITLNDESEEVFFFWWTIEIMTI